MYVLHIHAHINIIFMPQSCHFSTASSYNITFSIVTEKLECTDLNTFSTSLSALGNVYFQCLVMPSISFKFKMKLLCIVNW